MKTLLITTIWICTTLIALGQTNLLIKNINLRAKELKHQLNASKDTLVLEASRTINKLEIYNKKYSKHIEVDNNAINVPLNKLPLGKLIVEVVLKDKRIILTLIRQNDDKNFVDNLSTPDITNINDSGTVKNYITKKDSPLRLKKKNAVVKKKPKSYWVEYIISNGNSSYKTLRFANKSLVDKMIAKNKLEVKSVKGKLNHLTVWEVYDTTKFLRFKRTNADFEKASESEFFNTKPYYNSETFLANL